MPWFPRKAPGEKYDLVPTDAEIAECWRWFEEEVAIVEPQAVVLLGHPAARHFLNRYAGKRIGGSKPSLEALARRSYASVVGGRTLPAVAVYHPSGAYGALDARAQETYRQGQALLMPMLAGGSVS